MISVIVPAYNAVDTINKCLDNILNQNCTEDYELIVVDDGSSDCTAIIVSQYKNVKLIKQSNAGPAAARNKGAVEAKGDMILFTDSDCEVSPNWIDEMVRPFREYPEVVGVKGAYKTRQKELLARFVQLEYEDKYDKMKKDKYIDFIDTYSAGFKKDVFWSAGGYDLTFPIACAEDVDFSYRLASQHHKMVFNPKAVVFHKHPNNLKSYLQKKYKFAYWRIRALRKNPNKILKDSHTPFVMKVQVVLLFCILLSIPFFLTYFYIIPLFLGLYFITTLPFSIKAIKKDLFVGLLSPLFLFFRSIVQLFGLVGGIVKESFRSC